MENPKGLALLFITTRLTLCERPFQFPLLDAPHLGVLYRILDFGRISTYQSSTNVHILQSVDPSI
jgi:hypothetical protein